MKRVIVEVCSPFGNGMYCGVAHIAQEELDKCPVGNEKIFVAGEELNSTWGTPSEKEGYRKQNVPNYFGCFGGHNAAHERFKVDVLNALDEAQSHKPKVILKLHGRQRSNDSEEYSFYILSSMLLKFDKLFINGAQFDVSGTCESTSKPGYHTNLLSLYINGVRDDSAVPKAKEIKEEILKQLESQEYKPYEV